MSRRTKAKSYAEMNVQELAEVTAEFDKELVIDSFREPDEQARADWERAVRKPGRPRRGKGAKVISVSVEKGLLQRCDVLAKKQGVSRASLVDRGLRAVLAAEEVK